MLFPLSRVQLHLSTHAQFASMHFGAETKFENGVLDRNSPTGSNCHVTKRLLNHLWNVILGSEDRQ